MKSFANSLGLFITLFSAYVLLQGMQETALIQEGGVHLKDELHNWGPFLSCSLAAIFGILFANHKHFFRYLIIGLLGIIATYISTKHTIPPTSIKDTYSDIGILWYHWPTALFYILADTWEILTMLFSFWYILNRRHKAHTTIIFYPLLGLVALILKTILPSTLSLTISAGWTAALLVLALTFDTTLTPPSCRPALLSFIHLCRTPSFLRKWLGFTTLFTVIFFILGRAYINFSPSWVHALYIILCGISMRILSTKNRSHVRRYSFFWFMAILSCMFITHTYLTTSQWHIIFLLGYTQLTLSLLFCLILPMKDREFATASYHQSYYGKLLFDSIGYALAFYIAKEMHFILPLLNFGSFHTTLLLIILSYVGIWLLPLTAYHKKR